MGRLLKEMHSLGSCFPKLEIVVFYVLNILLLADYNNNQGIYIYTHQVFDFFFFARA